MQMQKKILALTGFTPKYGARQLATVIRNSLRRKIARMIVAGDLKKGDHLIIEKENDQKELTWKIERDGKMITYQS